MSIDWDTAVYDPLFGVFGVVATLDTGTEYEVTVIDQTSGIEVGMSPVDQPVISPAAFIRASEMADKGITEESMLEASLTFRGTTWTIKNVAAKPADGKGSGEFVLILINGDL